MMYEPSLYGSKSQSLAPVQSKINVLTQRYGKKSANELGSEYIRSYVQRRLISKLLPDATRERYPSDFDIC